MVSNRRIEKSILFWEGKASLEPLKLLDDVRLAWALSLQCHALFPWAWMEASPSSPTEHSQWGVGGGGGGGWIWREAFHRESKRSTWDRRIVQEGIKGHSAQISKLDKWEQRDMNFPLDASRGVEESLPGELSSYQLRQWLHNLSLSANEWAALIAFFISFLWEDDIVLAL